jgi:hypothetical protein
MAMNRIHRILIVIIIVMVLLIISMDYLVFHGSILLDKVANGVIVEALDAFGKLFEGPHAFTNFMFFAVISIGLLVGMVAMFYKFIKG